MPAIQRLSHAGVAALAFLIAAHSANSQTLLHTLQSPSVEDNAQFGRTVALAGDHDGDGIADLLIGALGESSDGVPNAGRVHIYSGGTGALIRTMNPFPASGVGFGWGMADIGDVRGDEMPDVVVGSPFSDGLEANAGSATLISGPASAEGFLSPAPTAFGSFGYAIARMDDVSGDDTTDYAVGAPGDGGATQDGRVYIYRGGDEVELMDTFASPSPQQAGDFGEAIARVGDLDGDGTSDLLIGAPNEAAAGNPSSSGRAYVLSGASGTLIHTLVSPNPTYLGSFGSAVSSAGDVNGDGQDDLLVGAFDSPGSSPAFAGRAYVFSGANGALLFSFASPQQQEQGYFGVSVASVGDASGDGVPDLLVGAGGDAGEGGESAAGRAYLFSGATGAVLQVFGSPNPEIAGRFGWAVAPAGDVNGDGLGDVLIGAFGEEVGAVEVAGRAYVFAGMDATAPVLTVGAAPASLWPANSAYSSFDMASLEILASDLSDPDVSADDVVIISVISDEPEDMPGNRDGATTRDITITYDCRSTSLRAERDGKHNGRVYTILLAVADAAGNVATAEYSVAAPIRRGAAAVRDLDAYTVVGCDPATGAPAASASPTSAGATPDLAFDLEANAPNPFGISTIIGFTVAEPSHVRLTVYDLTGRQVARLVDGSMATGRHEVRLEAGALSSGTYIYRLEAGAFHATRRLTVVR